MACNCKNTNRIEDKYGVKEGESLLEAGYRQLWKVTVLVIALTIGIVAVPVVILILIYNQIFRGGKGLQFPKILSKYLA